MPRPGDRQGVRGLVDKAHDDALAILRGHGAAGDHHQKIPRKEVIEGDDLKQMLEASVLEPSMRRRPLPSPITVL